MKQKTHPLFFSLLALLLVFLTACADSNGGESGGADGSADTPATYVYAEAPVSFNEPYGNLYQEASGWEVTQGNMTYRFTSAISEEERTTVVDDVTAMLTYIEENFGTLTEEYTICIRHDAYAPWTDGSTLYVGLPALRTPAFGASLAQMLYGRQVNYGICYAFATELLQELGYHTEELSVTLEEALTVCETSPLLLDLNYACFLSNYTDKDTLAKLKYLAIDFYRSLTREGKTELLTNYSCARYSQYLSDYLTEHGQEPYDTSDLEGISFYPCGEKMRLVWEDPYAIFYLHDTFTVKYNSYDKRMGVNDLLNSDYEHFRYVVTCYRLQAEEMERIIGHMETEGQEEQVPVLFIRDAMHEKIWGGGFFREDSSIRIYQYTAYPHEYVHYLTRGMVTDEWLREIFPNYCTMRGGNPLVFWRIDSTRAVYEDETATGPAADARKAHMAKVETHLGHTFDWTNPDDFTCQNNAFLLTTQQLDTLQEHSGEQAMTSFAHYLASLYGEEAMMQAVYYDTPYETMGKRWDELVADWKVWMHQEYAWILA